MVNHRYPTAILARVNATNGPSEVGSLCSGMRMTKPAVMVDAATQRTSIYRAVGVVKNP